MANLAYGMGLRGDSAELARLREERREAREADDTFHSWEITKAKKATKATKAPTAPKAPKAPQWLAAYITAGGKLRSVKILEEYGGVSTVEPKRAKGARPPRMVSRAESRKRNQIGRKLANAYANAESDQYSGADSARVDQHYRDQKFKFWSHIVGRRIRSKELSDLIRAENQKGFYFAAMIAAKF